MKNSDVALTNIDNNNHVYVESVVPMQIKTGYYGVCGIISSHCYLLTPDEDMAEKMCERYETDH